ncbi:MAG: hypothetical protein P8Y44_06600 [Acidobacteriota bacterium]
MKSKAATLFLGLLAAATLLAAQVPMFSDRTEESNLRFVHFNGMSGELYFPEVFGPGAALFDFDGDGDLHQLRQQHALAQQRRWYLHRHDRQRRNR